MSKRYPQIFSGGLFSEGRFLTGAFFEMTFPVNMKRRDEMKFHPFDANLYYSLLICKKSCLFTSHYHSGRTFLVLLNHVNGSEGPI